MNLPKNFRKFSELPFDSCKAGNSSFLFSQTLRLASPYILVMKLPISNFLSYLDYLEQVLNICFEIGPQVIIECHSYPLHYAIKSLAFTLRFLIIVLDQIRVLVRNFAKIDKHTAPNKHTGVKLLAQKYNFL